MLRLGCLGLYLILLFSCGLGDTPDEGGPGDVPGESPVLADTYPSKFDYLTCQGYMIFSKSVRLAFFPRF